MASIAPPFYSSSRRFPRRSTWFVAGLHLWRQAQRLVNPREVEVHVVGEGCGMVLDLLLKASVNRVNRPTCRPWLRRCGRSMLASMRGGGGRQ